MWKYVHEKPLVSRVKSSCELVTLTTLVMLDFLHLFFNFITMAMILLLFTLQLDPLEMIRVSEAASDATMGSGDMWDSCPRPDFRRVRLELGPCLDQFRVPEMYAAPLRPTSCCFNESARCCHGLRASLPIGDACVCTFLLHTLRSMRRSLPYTLDVRTALRSLSAQCSIDFHSPANVRCQLQ